MMKLKNLKLWFLNLNIFIANSDLRFSSGEEMNFEEERVLNIQQELIFSCVNRGVFI